MKGTVTDSKRLGIIGGGQLARMSLAPATALDVKLTVLCRDFGEATALVWPDVMLGSPDSRAAIAAVAGRCSVTTFDHELIDTNITGDLEGRGHRFAPSTAVLSVAQSKVLQHRRFHELGLPLPPFAIVAPGEDLAAVEQFGAMHGFPLMVKADRGGYDGRGVWKADDLMAATTLCRHLSERSTAAVIEALMPLEREVAQMVARNWSGEMAVWPLVETVQIDGMLRELRAPAMVSSTLHRQAADIAREIASQLDVVGVLAVEFFVAEQGLLVNEIATRPHNSGHHTIEGSVTSQFEQHIRAVLDLPLGETTLTAPHVATVNIVGQSHGRPPSLNLKRALQISGAHVHLYGKQTRPGRKLGHVTVTGDNRDSVLTAARHAVALLEGEDDV